MLNKYILSWIGLQNLLFFKTPQNQLRSPSFSVCRPESIFGNSRKIHATDKWFIHHLWAHLAGSEVALRGLLTLRIVVAKRVGPNVTPCTRTPVRRGGKTGFLQQTTTRKQIESSDATSGDVKLGESSFESDSKRQLCWFFGPAQLTHVHVAPGTNTHTQATLTLSHTNTHARKWGSFSAFLRCRLARQFQLGDRLWTRQKNESLEILWSVIITWRSLVKTNANTQHLHLHLHQNQIKKKGYSQIDTCVCDPKRAKL